MTIRGRLQKRKFRRHQRPRMVTSSDAQRNQTFNTLFSQKLPPRHRITGRFNREPETKRNLELCLEIIKSEKTPPSRFRDAPTLDGSKMS